MESKQLLENFLNKKYPHTEMHLSEEDKVFLSRYAVDRRQSNSVAMLKELDIGESFDRYFRENIYARGWKLSLLLLRSKRIHCASCISRRTYSFQKAQLQWESANRAKESSRRI